MSHANARLTVYGRAELVRRVIEQGRPVAHVVVEMNVSGATGYKWLARWRAEGPAGLIDRSSRAHRLPGRTPRGLEDKILAVRAARKLGPARIAPLVGLAPSTVHAVLRRHGMHRFAWMDHPTGVVIRRYERAAPGELLHVDVKKLGVIRDGGGWRVHGRGSPEHAAAHAALRAGRRAGYATCTARSMTTPDACCTRPPPGPRASPGQSVSCPVERARASAGRAPPAP